MARLRSSLGLALTLALAACASGLATRGEAGHEASLKQPQGQPGREAGVALALEGQWEGVLTRKGNAPFAWWALQTDSGEVWELELPGTGAEQTLLPRQNCRVLVQGYKSEGLRGAGRLQPARLSAVQRPELGEPENQRCQFSQPAPL